MAVAISVAALGAVVSNVKLKIVATLGTPETTCRTSTVFKPSTAVKLSVHCMPPSSEYLIVAPSTVPVTFICPLLVIWSDPELPVSSDNTILGALGALCVIAVVCTAAISVVEVACEICVVADSIFCTDAADVVVANAVVMTWWFVRSITTGTPTVPICVTKLVKTLLATVSAPSPPGFLVANSTIVAICTAAFCMANAPVSLGLTANAARGS